MLSGMRPFRALVSRSIPLALAALLLASLAPAVSANHLTVAEAERRVLSLLNDQRRAAGLRPVRIDARLMRLARERSVDMATRHYRAHVTPDGTGVAEMLADRGIKWYRWGEIIAWNSYDLDESTASAPRQWRNSRPHYEIITTADMNYAGVGAAYDSKEREWVWTAIFIKGPDRTGAWARMDSLSVTSTGSVAVRWRGADVRLASLTSGLRDFTVQRRVDGGSWATVWSQTTATSRTVSLARGHRYEYRARARDRAGNTGAWSPPMEIRR